MTRRPYLQPRSLGSPSQAAHGVSHCTGGCGLHPSHAGKSGRKRGRGSTSKANPGKPQKTHIEPTRFTVVEIPFHVPCCFMPSCRFDKLCFVLLSFDSRIGFERQPTQSFCTVFTVLSSLYVRICSHLFRFFPRSVQHILLTGKSSHKCRSGTRKHLKNT